MNKKIIVFGDLHSDSEATRVILDEARHLSIDSAINLGDEVSIFDNTGEFRKVYDALMRFRDEEKGRELICCLGDKTGGVIPALKANYVGFSADGGRIGSLVLKKGSIIAAHDGELILREFGKMISEYKGLEPLVIFHGHSHSMGVLPEYKWLKKEEFVYFLPEGELVFRLEPSKVYWVNPGSSGPNIVGKPSYANFAIYDLEKRVITLKTKTFERS